MRSPPWGADGASGDERGGLDTAVASVLAGTRYIDIGVGKEYDAMRKSCMKCESPLRTLVKNHHHKKV